MVEGPDDGEIKEVAQMVASDLAWRI